MRSFAGVLTIPISGALGATVLLLRGPLNFPLTEGSGWLEMASSSSFLPYQTLMILAYVLPFVGFLALYEVLSKEARVERISLLGLIFTLWGTALALPALGIASFVVAEAGQLAAADQGTVGRVVTDAVTSSGLGIGIVAAILYTVGPALLGIAMWRHGRLSNPAAVLFGVHGVWLSFGFAFFPALIVGWLLLTAGGILMSIDVRTSPSLTG